MVSTVLPALCGKANVPVLCVCTLSLFWGTVHFDSSSTLCAVMLADLGRPQVVIATCVGCWLAVDVTAAAAAEAVRVACEQPVPLLQGAGVSAAHSACW